MNRRSLNVTSFTAQVLGKVYFSQTALPTKPEKESNYKVMEILDVTEHVTF